MQNVKNLEERVERLQRLLLYVYGGACWDVHHGGPQSRVAFDI